jgi:hypothetical protein
MIECPNSVCYEGFDEIFDFFREKGVNIVEDDGEKLFSAAQTMAITKDPYLSESNLNIRESAWLYGERYMTLPAVGRHLFHTTAFEEPEEQVKDGEKGFLYECTAFEDDYPEFYNAAKAADAAFDEHFRFVSLEDCVLRFYSDLNYEEMTEYFLDVDCNMRLMVETLKPEDDFDFKRDNRFLYVPHVYVNFERDTVAMYMSRER